MLSVLKQEFKIHKKNIFITAIIFAAIYLCTIFSMHLSGLFESEKIQDISALWFGLSVGLGYIGAFFIALFKGSGSMNDILFKDTGYLIKTIPVSSWKLILGKMIIGLFEFIVYFALYLLFMTFIFHCGEEIALALSMDIQFNDFCFVCWNNCTFYFNSIYIKFFIYSLYFFYKESEIFQNYSCNNNLLSFFVCS